MRFGSACPLTPWMHADPPVARRPTRGREAVCVKDFYAGCFCAVGQTGTMEALLLRLLSVLVCWLLARMGVGGLFILFIVFSRKSALFINMLSVFTGTKWAAYWDKMGGLLGQNGRLTHRPLHGRTCLLGQNGRLTHRPN